MEADGGDLSQRFGGCYFAFYNLQFAIFILQWGVE